MRQAFGQVEAVAKDSGRALILPVSCITCSAKSIVYQCGQKAGRHRQRLNDSIASVQGKVCLPRDPESN